MQFNEPELMDILQLTQRTTYDMEPGNHTLIIISKKLNCIKHLKRAQVVTAKQRQYTALEAAKRYTKLRYEIYTQGLGIKRLD